jgi:hypothetical protein
MTNVLRIVAAMLVLAPAVARAGKPGESTLALVQAQCAGPPPAPCSASFRFARGQAVLRTGKQPSPTREPSEQRAGELKLTGVTKAGAAFTGALAVEVVYKTTFSADTNTNCELAGVQIETPSLMGTVSCRNGKCSGRLLPIAALPKHCADAGITSELVTLVVRDDGGAALAVPGTAVVPGRGDAP